MHPKILDWWKPDRDMERQWKVEYEGATTYFINFSDKQERDRAEAMIEFCTKYENERFELFYKWFAKNRKE